MNNNYIEKFLEVNEEVSISYNLLGFSDSSKNDNDKLTFIFVHGLGGDLAAWNEIRESIYEKGFRSIALDVRGHGFSSRPLENQSYEINEMANDVIKIIEDEDLENVVLVGHCFGGMLVQQVAVKNIKQVKKIILISSSCSPLKLLKKSKISEGITKLTTSFEKYLSRSHEFGRINHRKYGGTGDYNIFRFVNDLRNTSLSSYAQVFSKICNFNICDELGKVTIDSLVIVGEKDKIFPKSASINICKCLPNSRIEIIEGADHILIFSHFKKLVDLIFRATATISI